MLNQNKFSSKSIKLTEEYDKKSFTEAIKNYCNKNSIEMIDNWKIHLSIKFKRIIQKSTKEEIEKLVDGSKLDLYESTSLPSIVRNTASVITLSLLRFGSIYKSI